MLNELKGRYEYILKIIISQTHLHRPWVLDFRVLSSGELSDGSLLVGQLIGGGRRGHSG